MIPVGCGRTVGRSVGVTQPLIGDRKAKGRTAGPLTGRQGPYFDTVQNATSGSEGLCSGTWTSGSRYWTP
jgi:hypothetical protein